MLYSYILCILLLLYLLCDVLKGCDSLPVKRVCFKEVRKAQLVYILHLIIYILCTGTYLYMGAWGAVSVVRCLLTLGLILYFQ